MAAWRDGASLLVQGDLDRLLDDATRFAQQEVRKHGSFFPFAVVVENTGEATPMMLEPGEEHPEPSDVIAMLWRGLQEMRGHLRATAICVDVRMPTLGTDAIQVYLEHRDGVSVATMMPYSKRRLGRKVHYGDIEAAATRARVWRSEQS